MPYCSSESKIAGFDEMEVEVQSEDLSGTSISYSVHLTRPCASCGTEAATADLEFDVEIEHDCEDPDTAVEANWTRTDLQWLVSGSEITYDTRAEALQAAGDNASLLIAQWPDDGETPEYDLQSSDAEATDDTQRTDRHGKPITNSRYMRRLLGAEVTAHVHCNRCGEDFDVTGSDNLPASSFEVMNH